MRGVGELAGRTRGTLTANIIKPDGSCGGRSGRLDAVFRSRIIRSVAAFGLTLVSKRLLLRRMAVTRLDSDERGKAIVAAAVPLFARKGLAGTTTKELAEAAGIFPRRSCSATSRARSTFTTRSCGSAVKAIPLSNVSP